MLGFLPHSLWKAALILSLLVVGCGRADSLCTKRRCLAEMLIKRNFVSQPQNENCTQAINVPFIEYQTLSVDTKNLRLISRLHALLEWSDPELGWNTSVYPHNEVVLPVRKVWTPELHVTNGIATTMRHGSLDLLVNSNGIVKHSVIINAEVDCEVNLFNYPFASDACPVAIHTWADGDYMYELSFHHKEKGMVDGVTLRRDGCQAAESSRPQFETNKRCGTQLEFSDLKMVDGTHGDWQTDDATLVKLRDDRIYIMVSLTIKYINPFITLLLPSILIVLADVVSFALPLGGGERNSFKVTLVLSFTMFLIILNDELPGDSQCSPIIRTHFCVCLVLMVLSMLVSLVLTRVAADGGLIFCCCSKGSVPENKEEKEDEEAKADISVIQLNGSEPEDSQMLRKVVNFLEALEAQTLETERRETFANKLDKTYFWFYFILGTAYFVAMTCVMVNYKCSVNHFDFWYD